MNFNEEAPIKILLILLPYWAPQIPPMGISCLKGFLARYGFEVKTADANVEETFKEIGNCYFDTLKQGIAAAGGGIFYNLGHDVLRDHLMAHLNHEDPDEYSELVRLLVARTFYVEPDKELIDRLNEWLSEYYRRLEAYMLAQLEKERPDVLGLSVYRGNLSSAIFAFRLAKKKYPHLRTVMGGAIFAGDLAPGSENMELFREKVPEVDHIIVGEGELLFLKWLQGELPPSQRVYTLADIGGETLSPASAPLPDFSDLPLRRYPHLAAYTSRSCPYQCSFCTETIYWGRFRKKKARQIVEELRTLYRRYGSQLFLLCDSLLNPVASDLAEALIEANESFYWDGYLRADKQVGESDRAFCWRRGGLYRARLGVETGSDRVLKLMGKGVTVDQVKASVSSLAQAGIKTTTYWVIGHPGEREEDFAATLRLVEELQDDIYEAWGTPFHYYLSGQVKSDEWRHRSIPLFPQEFRQTLLVQTWTLDVAPRRAEAYRRMRRFADLCRRLGIPNPYSLFEFNQADERWQRLHHNAVPPLLAFEDRQGPIDENKRVQKPLTARKRLSRDMDFGF